jgi:thiol:disulfide interchange protein DsbD
MKIFNFAMPLLVICSLWTSSWALAQDANEELVLDIQRASITPHHGPANLQRTLKLELTLKPGFKAYVDKFGLNILEPYPTKNSVLQLSPIHEFYDKFSKSKKQGLKESGTLTTTVEIQQPLDDGNQKMIFELRFQACSETVCYFPQTIKREVSFMVASPQSDSAKEKKSLGLLEENFSNAQKRGLPYLFIFVFLAGVLTSLTPCLLPMLPLTIAVIGKGHSHDAKLKKFMNALTYVMGIATTYSFLGVLAASSGALFGNILSNIWVQVGFGTAFVFMGLAQFGLFEFQTPLWLQNRFHKMSTGTGGIYITGLLSGFIASPCVGPVLVGILTFIAQSQDRMLGFALMFAYALGLGQLLMVLGVSSSLLYRFPKAPWLMRTSKTILGFALIASGLFYLSLLWPKPNDIQKGPVAEAATLPNNLPWEVYSEKALADAKAAGKPVLIDFYAEWCLACKELEEKTFSHPEVQEALNGMVLLKFDATEETPELAPLRERYKIVGLPTIVFYDKQGQWLNEMTLNEFESPEQFAARIRRVKQ